MPRKQPIQNRKPAPTTREGASGQGAPARRSGLAGLTQPRPEGRSLFSMKSLAARPRIAALIIAFVGYVLTEVNRLTVLRERNFYPMLMLFGPVCILFGIAGAIDPRVMNQAGVEQARTKNIFRAISVAIVLAGLGIGWAMAHFWYHIW